MTEDQTQALSLIAAYRFGSERGLGSEIAEIRNMAIDGFRNASSVRRGYIVHLLEERGLFEEFRDKHWAFGKTPVGESKYRRYRSLWRQHEELLAGKRPDDEVEKEQDDGTETEQGFAFESELRDYLAHNLEVLESGLRLYSRDNRTGVEYAIDGGQIDILAIDRDQKFVVIELKLGRGRNRTIGQLLYYMGWVDEHLGQGPCRGIILAREITEDLLTATSRVPGVSLFRYSVSMSVAPVVRKLSKA